MRRGGPLHLAVLDLKLNPVPGAGDDLLLQFSLSRDGHAV